MGKYPTTQGGALIMGLPKIPSPEEIAETTRKAMQPMMEELESISGLLQQILGELQQQNGKKAAA